MAGAGDGAIFEAVYSHCEGAAAFRIVQIWFGNEVAIDVPHVQGGFEGGMFYWGDAPGGSCSPGAAMEIETPEATLDCSMSTATPVGDQMIVEWAVRFDPALFGGPRAIWLDAKGGAGDPEPRLGWTQVGSYDVQAVAGDGSGGSDDTGGTAGGVGAATGTGAATDSDDASSTAAVDGDATGKLPGLVPGPDDPTGCACASAASSDRTTAWAFVLVAVAAGFRRSRRSAERAQTASSSPPEQSLAPSHTQPSGSSLPSAQTNVGKHASMSASTLAGGCGHPVAASCRIASHASEGSVTHPSSTRQSTYS